MSTPEVERVAQLIAEHALVLLAAGVLAAFGSLGVLLAVIRVAARFRIVTAIAGSYVAIHLAIGLIVTAAVTVFVVLTEEVLGGGELARFDVAFARALRDQATPDVERFFAGVSWLGEREAIAAITLAVAILLMANRLLVTALAWIGAQAGGGVLNLTLKETYARTRPEFADPLLAASSWSFPSGHAMGTFIVCGVGAYLLLRDRPSWTRAALVVAAAFVWSLLMAFSRLYLGVHFASDVAAGLIAGLAWVGVCISALEVVRRRRGRQAAPVH